MAAVVRVLDPHSVACSRREGRRSKSPRGPGTEGVIEAARAASLGDDRSIGDRGYLAPVGESPAIYPILSRRRG